MASVCTMHWLWLVYRNQMESMVANQIHVQPMALCIPIMESNGILDHSRNLHGYLKLKMRTIRSQSAYPRTNHRYGINLFSHVQTASSIPRH